MADKAPGEAARNPLLFRANPVESTALDLVRNLTVHRGGRRSRFRGELKDARALELPLLDEIDQLLIRRVRFARETDDQGRSQNKPRNLFAEFRQQVLRLRLVDAAVHLFEQLRIAVLERNVDIRQNRRRSGRFQAVKRRQLVAPMLRISIKDANPIEPVFLLERRQELRQTRLAEEVAPPERRFLRDQDQLANARDRQPLRFVDDRFERLADEPPANFRNRAISAEAVATVRDLQIRDVRRRQRRSERIVERQIPRRRIKETRRRDDERRFSRFPGLRVFAGFNVFADLRRFAGFAGFAGFASFASFAGFASFAILRDFRRFAIFRFREEFANDVDDFRFVERTQPSVDFREARRQLFAVRNDRATGNQQEANAPRRFLRDRFGDKLGGFVASGAQKTASVQEENVDALRFRRHFPPQRGQATDHRLRVD